GNNGVDLMGNPVGYSAATLEVGAIEVPVLLRAAPGIGGGVHPSFVIGPSFSFETSERLRTTGAFGGTRDTDTLKNTDVGLATGVGLDFPSAKGFWRFDVRSNFGLTNIEEPAVGDGGIHNWNVVTMIGYGWKP